MSMMTISSAIKAADVTEAQRIALLEHALADALMELPKPARALVAHQLKEKIQEVKQ